MVLCSNEIVQPPTVCECCSVFFLHWSQFLISASILRDSGPLDYEGEPEQQHFLPPISGFIPSSYIWPYEVLLIKKKTEEGRGDEPEWITRMIVGWCDTTKWAARWELGLDTAVRSGSHQLFISVSFWKLWHFACLSLVLAKCQIKSVTSTFLEFCRSIQYTRQSDALERLVSSGWIVCVLHMYRTWCVCLWESLSSPGSTMTRS